MLTFIQEQAGKMARQSRWLALVSALMLPALGIALYTVHQSVSRTLRNDARLPAPSTPASSAPAAPDLESQLRMMCAELTGAPDATRAEQKLGQIREFLNGLPPEVAVLVLRDFLDSQADASTRLGFLVDGDGHLVEAPTLRTFLLDLQGRLDPEEARDYAVKVLETSDSPDEWALALRHLGGAGNKKSHRSLMAKKLRTMLQHKPWQQNPSAGYLEAFDAAVFLGQPEFIPLLTPLIRPHENQALAHAAYLALDRLVIAKPLPTLQELLAKPSLMNGTELIRAGYFARARVEDPRQRQLLERYLLSPGRTAAELKTFANLFPNANFLVSNNLLTRTPTPGHAALVKMDRASLRVVREWSADPRFRSLQPHLVTIQSRLVRFVEQAGMADSRR